LHFNLVDWLLLAAFALALADGARRGFAPYASELGALTISLIVAFALFQPVGDLLHRVLQAPVGLAGVGSFLGLLVAGHTLVFAGVQGWARAGGRVLAGMRKEVAQAAGALPALATALTASAVVLTTLVSLPAQPAPQSWIGGSFLGSTITHSFSFMQPPLHSLLGPAARDSQGLFTPTPTPESDDDAFYTLKFPPDLQIEPDAASEERMLQLLNAARSKAGLPGLKMDAQLQAAARDHSRDMFVRAYFSHATPEHRTPFDRMRAQGARYVTAGENIAYSPDVEQAHASLMDSPEHRANILNPDFKRVGIGVFRGLGGQQEMFTQDFADYD
jgi:uncharacterized protein YkwD